MWLDEQHGIGLSLFICIAAMSTPDSNALTLAAIFMIPIKLKEYIDSFKEELYPLTRREGTILLTERIVKFSLTNNIEFRQEVSVNYDNSQSGRLDFVLYHDKFIYPIEIDTTHKGKSFRKLLSFVERENYFPIWIRWNSNSERDKSVNEIFMIDLTRESGCLERNIPLELDSPMPFGLYKGLELRVIIMNNPKYVRWCITNIYLYQLSQSAITFLEEFEKPKTQ